MKTRLFALALAIGMMPIGALAQNTNTPTMPTDQQRQQMRQTFERFEQQEEQLHQQFRSQVLSSMTPIHLRAVGETIGELAVMQNPNPETAAKRIDQILSAGERQRIMVAHQNFRTQAMTLHQQMKTELQNEMPAGHPWGDEHKDEHNESMQHMNPDAGTILLMALVPHHMGMMGHMMEGGFHH